MRPGYGGLTTILAVLESCQQRIPKFGSRRRRCGAPRAYDDGSDTKEGSDVAVPWAPSAEGGCLDTPISTKQGIMDAMADLTSRLTQLLNTPGISDQVRKQVEGQLKAQERNKKEIERILS